MKSISLLFLSAVLTTLIGCAERKLPPADASPKSETAEQAPRQLSPEEMMSLMKDAATPGVEHEKLAALVGTWKATATMWMEPGKKPEVSKGTSVNRWILGKRFVKQDYTGKFSGRPFSGTGMWGFDKVKKKYFSTWFDTMTTGMMSGEGDFNSATNEIVMKSEFSCPVTGGTRSTRTVTRIVSKTEHVFEMYELNPNGAEIKMMEIVYKRFGK